MRPICGNCKKRYIDNKCCDYSLADPGRRQNSPHSNEQPKGLTESRSLAVLPSGLDHYNILELKLIHHYTKTTCDHQNLNQMFPRLSHPRWQIDIPQMAFSSEIVLNALLGISAFHLLCLNPSDTSLDLASRKYLHTALVKQRAAMETIDFTNAEPIVVAGILLAFHHRKLLKQ